MPLAGSLGPFGGTDKGLKVGVVADDLTGAGDAGLAFFRRGLATWVVNDAPQRNPAGLEAGWDGLPGGIPADVGVVAVNAGGRALDPGHAADRVSRAASWLAAQGCQSFYHKIDSTLRGNLAAEISRLLHALEMDLAVVAPAFPEAGRITIGGFQLVGGVPVSLSPYGQDPIGPVVESHLPTILQEAGIRSALIDLRTVLAGWERIVGAIAEAAAKGARAVVVDVARLEDLGQIARAVAHLGPKVLPVGSAGLARELLGAGAARRLPQILAPSGDPGGPGVRPVSVPVLGRTSPVLIVSGSCNPVTLEQVNHMQGDARIVTVDVRQLLLTDGREPGAAELHGELEGTARQALQGLLAGRDVIVTTASTAEQVARDQALGRDLGLSAWQVGEQLTVALGALTRRLTERVPINGIVVAGGQTASAVCQALGAQYLEISGEALPAVPILRAVGLDLHLVTKSGGFGSPDALGRIASRLRQEAGRIAP